MSEIKHYGTKRPPQYYSKTDPDDLAIHPAYVNFHLYLRLLPNPHSRKVHYNAFKEVLFKDGLACLANPQRIRDIATAKLFTTHSDGFIAYENTTCVPSLVGSAHGKILELGPGPGNQIHRYDPTEVDFIYAVDPNSFYRDEINARVNGLQLQDRYKFLVCGVEDSDVLLSGGITEGSMDTVLSIQVLCAVGDVKSVMRAVWKLLKPGGCFIFWEHEQNRDTGTAIAQACLNPAWSAMMGCCLNRDIKADILAAGEWENAGDIQVGDEPYSALPRIWGILRKKA